MIIFIDDSGDAGFKFNKGSSRYFVIAAVIFEDELEAESTALAIKKFKRKLAMPDYREFKFNKSLKDIRCSFLNEVSSFNFNVRCLVIDKTLIYSKNLREEINLFYSYAIKQLLKNNNDTILNAKIRIDGSGSREFKLSFQTYLRKHLNSEQKIVMKNCQLVDSKTNVLIQMADMIAGAIRRSYHIEKTDASVYKTIIKKHISDEWTFE